MGDSLFFATVTRAVEFHIDWTLKGCPGGDTLRLDILCGGRCLVGSHAKLGQEVIVDLASELDTGNSGDNHTAPYYIAYPHLYSESLNTAEIS